MVNVFGGSSASGPGNLQMVKKVVLTEGKFRDYTDEIQKIYEFKFTPYRLHKNTDGTFVTPLVIKIGGYMYWTMLLQWRLSIEALQRIQ